MRHVFTNGVPKSDRTGTGTVSVFGHQMRFDLAEGYPLVTTKRVHFPSVAKELLWFLRGEGERPLAAGGRGHDLGRVGGRGRRPRPGLRRAVAQLADSGRGPRRPGRGGRTPPPRGAGLAAHHRRRPGTSPSYPRWRSCRATRSSSSTSRTGRSSCQIYQRSADIFLGVPFNIASYALLTHLFAQQADLDVGELVWTGGDCHIYDNHREQVETQLGRSPFPYPTLRLRRRPPTMFDYGSRTSMSSATSTTGDPGSSRSLTISLVAAVARNGVIGRDGGLPGGSRKTRGGFAR